MLQWHLMSKSLRLHIGPEYAEMPWRKPQAIEPLPEAFVYVSGKNTFHPVGKCHQVRFASVDLDFLVHMNVDQPVDPHTYVVTDALTSTHVDSEQLPSRPFQEQATTSERSASAALLERLCQRSSMTTYPSIRLSWPTYRGMTTITLPPSLSS